MCEQCVNLQMLVDTKSEECERLKGMLRMRVPKSTLTEVRESHSRQIACFEVMEKGWDHLLGGLKIMLRPFIGAMIEEEFDRRKHIAAMKAFAETLTGNLEEEPNTPGGA